MYFATFVEVLHEQHKDSPSTTFCKAPILLILNSSWAIMIVFHFQWWSGVFPWSKIPLRGNGFDTMQRLRMESLHRYSSKWSLNWMSNRYGSILTMAINMDPYLLDMQWRLKKNMIPSRWFCKCFSSVVQIFFGKLNHLTTKVCSMSCWQVTTYWDAIWASSSIVWNLILTNFQITWVMLVKSKVSVFTRT